MRQAVPLLLSIAFVCASSVVRGQAAPAFLEKTAVETLVVGHKLTLLRIADNNKVIWTVEKNGALFGENASQGTRDTAKWTLSDSGELCVKWRGNSKDGCRLFSMIDDKTVMFDSATPTVPNANVEKID